MGRNAAKGGHEGLARESFVREGFVEAARILSPVESLGPGRRVVLWLQGCDIAAAGHPCEGCISQDLWERGNGRLYRPDELAAELLSLLAKDGLTGLTVTGGEPLDQHSGLHAMLSALRAKAADAGAMPDVLIFTRHGADEFEECYPGLARLVDAGVFGEYRADLPSDTPLVASSNQELRVFHSEYVDRFSIIESAPRMQAFIQDGDLVFAGIPLAGGMKAIEEALKRRGIDFESVSWREGYVLDM